jgi:GAF domain-containing protein
MHGRTQKDPAMIQDTPQHHQPDTGVALDPQSAFAELGRIALDQTPLSQVLKRVADLAKATIPGADEVSVTLIEQDRARSVAFTGDLAVALDERQYDRGFGPCMDAALGAGTVLITDMATDERYREFGAVAARAGIRSSLSVGMPAPERTVGGVNTYSRRVDAFDEAAVATATAFADFAAVAVLNAALVDSKTALAAQLQEAMASRAVIEQAKGLLIGRLGCTPDEAFTHLSRQSQNTNRKLRDVAAQIVADAQHSRR